MNTPRGGWLTALWHLLMSLMWTLPPALATGWFVFLAFNALPGQNHDTMAMGLLAMLPAAFGMGLGAVVGALLGRRVQLGLTRLGLPAGLSAAFVAALFMGITALIWPHLPNAALAAAHQYAPVKRPLPPTTPPSSSHPAPNACQLAPPPPGSPAYRSWEQECK